MKPKKLGFVNVTITKPKSKNTKLMYVQNKQWYNINTLLLFITGARPHKSWQKSSHKPRKHNVAVLVKKTTTMFSLLVSAICNLQEIEMFDCFTAIVKLGKHGSREQYLHLRSPKTVSVMKLYHVVAWTWSKIACNTEMYTLHFKKEDTC